MRMNVGKYVCDFKNWRLLVKLLEYWFSYLMNISSNTRVIAKSSHKTSMESFDLKLNKLQILTDKFSFHSNLIILSQRNLHLYI